MPAPAADVRPREPLDCRRGSAAHGRSRLPAVPGPVRAAGLGRPRAQPGPRAVRGPRAPPAGTRDLRDQPPQLGRPAGPPRRAARQAQARDVRPEGGGHARGRSQPADRVDRLLDPVPAREVRPDRDHATRPAGARGRLGDRDHGGGADPPRRARAAAARRRLCVLRPAGRRPDRPDRDQRHELAGLRAARAGPRGRADPGRGPRDARGRRRSHGDDERRAPARSSRTSPTRRRPAASVAG